MTRTDEKDGVNETGILPPEAYVMRHKTAFRTAFDFLNAHFPPEMEEKYWADVSHDMCTAHEKAGADELSLELLTGVFNYLEDEFKKRRQCDATYDH